MTAQAVQTPEQQEWLPKLLGYNFTIEYKRGRANVVADSLSRGYLMACSIPVNDWLEDIRCAQRDDAEVLALISKVGQPNSQGTFLSLGT